MHVDSEQVTAETQALGLMPAEEVYRQMMEQIGNDD